jgi:hypothetical protein
MHTEQKEKISYTTEYVVGAGYLLFFCLAFSLYSIFFYFTYLQPKPAPINTFATNLPPKTPTPHILSKNHQNVSTIFEDDFHDDVHDWSYTGDYSSTSVKQGKLFLEARQENSYGYIVCKSCPYLNKPFYLQADFSTSEATDKSFGIIFNHDSRSDRFYLFQINTEAKKYYLYHHTAQDWSLRAAGESDQIKSFPAVNTLGMYVDQNLIELYVNGKIIDSYTQSSYSFHKGSFAFFIDGSDFRLAIDNLVIKYTGT